VFPHPLFTIFSTPFYIFRDHKYTLKKALVEWKDGRVGGGCEMKRFWQRKIDFQIVQDYAAHSSMHYKSTPLLYLAWKAIHSVIDFCYIQIVS
jgi:hypothetical protein